jgi:hypothetical protein
VREIKCYACSKIFALSKIDEISKSYLFSSDPQPATICETCFPEFSEWLSKQREQCLMDITGRSSN